MIDRRIKSLPLFGRSLDLKFRQLPFPQFFAFSFQACKSFSFQFLHIQFRPITAHCRDSGLHRNHFSLTGRETHPETQVFSPGFETTPETVSIVFHRNSILHNSKIPERFRKYSRKINMPFRSPPFYQFITDKGRIILYPKITPGTTLPQGMVHVQQDKRTVRLGIGKLQDSASNP